jgi:iron complex outermembrane receptor protein
MIPVWHTCVIKGGSSRHTVWFQTRFIAVLLFFAALVHAQQSDPAAAGRLNGLSLEELGNIEVTTVSKGPVKLSQTAAAIFVITQEDIRRSGVRTLPEALRLAPGVDVAQIDSVKWAVGIRGFQSRLSRDILVLIDGRSVYDPLFHGVYWEVQDTLIEDIDRIEVIRGPGGTIWGANAVNGVINIITKNAKDTRGTLVSAGGGTVDQGFLDFRQGGGGGGVGHDNGFNYRIYGKGVDTGPEYHSDHLQFDDWRRAQGGFRTDWDINSNNSLTIQGDLYDGVSGENVRITIPTPPSAQAVQKNAQLSGGNLLTRWDRKLKGGSDVQVQAYYDRVNRLQANQAEYRNTFDVDFVHHVPMHRQDFIYGLEARLSPASLPAIIPTYVFTPDERTDQLYTAYAQDSFSLVPDKLSLTAGAKLLHSSFVGFDVEPSVRLLWTPTPRRTVWGAVTRAVRTPSDIEDTLQNTSLLSANPVAYSVTRGNGTFTSETLIGYEAGYRSLLSKTFSLDIAAFYNSYDHLQSLEPGTPFTEDIAGTQALIYPYFNGNGVKGTTSGIEIAPDWKPTSWWRLQGSYSLLHMDLRLAPGSLDTATVGSDEGSSPHHQARLQSFFDVSRNVEFSLTFRYVGDLPFYVVKGYETGDARIAWRPVAHIEFAVVGQNLLQPHHFEYGGDPGPMVGIKRSVFASLTFKK